MAAVPKENWGKHHTIFAIMVAIAHPQPSTGLISLLMDTKGLCPVDKVTCVTALSMMMPSRMATGCNQSRLYPARTPRNRLEARDPPPRVIADCNQPGPESLE